MGEGVSPRIVVVNIRRSVQSVDIIESKITRM